MPELMQGVESLTLLIEQEVLVAAPVETTFAALLEQLTTECTHADGKPMPMKLELQPGGRWFRDLGGEDGHWWGTVQAVKRPWLLEICGPLFMSSAVANNVQYRLSEAEGGTLIRFRHSGIGLHDEKLRSGIHGGWSYIHSQAKLRAERMVG